MIQTRAASIQQPPITIDSATERAGDARAIASPGAVPRRLIGVPRVPQRKGRSPAPGVTLIETVVGLSLIFVLAAALIPVLTSSRMSAERIISIKNLTILGEAHACYALDWEGRQYSNSAPLAGSVQGNCSAYINAVSCPSPALLGWAQNGAAWGYFLPPGATCTIVTNGFCSNWIMYQPMNFQSVNLGFGSFRLPSLRGFQEYVEGVYYSPRWFSSLDTRAYDLASEFFSIPAQFPGISSPSELAMPSYVNSPAALFDPAVFRRPSAGGFQHPNTFDTAYDSPAQDQCLFPDLKSRMIEHNWLIDPPAESNPSFSGFEPYYFNHGIASKPAVLFFDGSVGEMTMVQAVADDLDVLASTGGIDGLWHRGTPMGANGYFGAQAYDDTRNSFHILTTDGIQGRDFLRRVPNARDQRNGGGR